MMVCDTCGKYTCRCTPGGGHMEEDQSCLVCGKAVCWCGSQCNPPDPINPPHYTNQPSGIETIRITEWLNFPLGCVVKYILRCDSKGDALTDLRKAQWYLNREIQRREGEK